jgi:hypothetical protein
LPGPPFLGPIHQVRSLAQGYARQLLLELLKVDATPRPEVIALLLERVGRSWPSWRGCNGPCPRRA